MKTIQNPTWKPEGRTVYYCQGRRNCPSYEIAVTIIDGNNIQFFIGQEQDNESRLEAMLKAIVAGPVGPVEMMNRGWQVPQLVKWAIEECEVSEFAPSPTFAEVGAALAGRVEFDASRKKEPLPAAA